MMMPHATTHVAKLDSASWHPSKQIDYTKVPYRQARERPCEGVITSAKLDGNVISGIDGRSANVQKFGSSGRIGGIPSRCHRRTVAQGDVEGDSDVDDWQERKGAAKLKTLIKCVAHSPPNKNLPLTQLAPESPGGWSRGEDSESDHSTCVNWEGKRVPGHQINRKDAISKAQADEGDLIDVDTKEEPSWNYSVNAPTDGIFPRDMAREEIAESWEEVFAAKVKEIAWLYELGCFKQWPRWRSDNTIDARWVITWKMVEGNVGIKCRFIVRGFKDKCQDLDIYAGTTSRSGQRLVNAVSAEEPGFILFSFDLSQVFAKRYDI